MVVLLGSCGARGDAPEAEPPEPQIRRLTRVQYTNSIHDALGAAIVVPTSLEPDEDAGGLASVGASLASISPRGVELYETAAAQIAAQVMDDAALRASNVLCEPAAARDDACAAEVVRVAGRKLWRRPLEDAEVDVYVAVAGGAAAAVGDFHGGLEYALSGLLQSPNFLFRVELGEPDPERVGAYRFTSLEMAPRLSYLLWNTTPDEELLAAAEAGELVTVDGLSAQVDRLIADPRARDGLRNFFTEMLDLDQLDALNKDALIFTHMSADVGPSAREETLRGIEAIVEEDGDVRDFVNTRRAFVNRKLSAIYGIPAPSLDDFAETELPEDGLRRGFLGQASFLALQSHPANTSVTLRGKYLREVLFCAPVPPPPSNLNTAIPEVSDEAPTMRDRVEQHLEDPYCAGCHNVMDPIGLGFENFDGLGTYRESENGVAIDASGDLDGQVYAGPVELADLVHDDEKLARCVVQTYLQYANGHVIDAGERSSLEWHDDGFADEGHRMRALMRDVAMGMAFRSAGEVTP